MNFKFVSADGTKTCSLALSHLWADVFAIEQRGSGNCSAQEWAKLIQQAQASASEQNAGSVLFRIIEGTGSAELIDLLPSLGFKFKEGRREFRAFLSDLPDDQGTPIEWRTAKSLEWTNDEIAEALAKANVGAIDAEPSDDPLTHITDWLSDPSLLAGPDCIAVGFVDEVMAALVVAQVNPRTLWSRISYMAITPEFRGRGFGEWVHRKGFAMLKSQGGDLYHGGTNSKNSSMIRLFEKHGCHPYHKMQEWKWSREHKSEAEVLR